MQRQRQPAERHQPPVVRLHAGRADALVPDLGRLLVGRDRLRRLAVAQGARLNVMGGSPSALVLEIRAGADRRAVALAQRPAPRSGRPGCVRWRRARLCAQAGGAAALHRPPAARTAGPVGPGPGGGPRRDSPAPRPRDRRRAPAPCPRRSAREAGRGRQVSARRRAAPPASYAAPTRAGERRGGPEAPPEARPARRAAAGRQHAAGDGGAAERPRWWQRRRRRRAAAHRR